MSDYKTKEEIKKEIIKLFRSELKGKKFQKNTSKHDGAEGHFAEKCMGITPNSDNSPDKWGFEQKKEAAKITLFDLSASVYLFTPSTLSANKNTVLQSLLKKHNLPHTGKKTELIKRLKENSVTIPQTKEELLKIKHGMPCDNISRKVFLQTFGTPNPQKNNRYSWSGTCFPKYGTKFNHCGQRMLFDTENNLLIEYSFLEDKREQAVKDKFPEFVKNHHGIFPIAIWKQETLETTISNKFGVLGFYILNKDSKGFYESISFGNIIDFEKVKSSIENGNVILDSGMKDGGGSRNYSHFRGTPCKFWNGLIDETIN